METPTYKFLLWALPVRDGSTQIISDIGALAVLRRSTQLCNCWWKCKSCPSSQWRRCSLPTASGDCWAPWLKSTVAIHAALRLYMDSIWKKWELEWNGVWGILRSWLGLPPKSQCHPWMQIKPCPFQRMCGFFLKLQPSLISTASGMSMRSLLKDRRIN